MITFNLIWFSNSFIRNTKNKTLFILSPAVLRRIQNALVIWASTDFTETFKNSVISMLVIKELILG